MLLDLIAFQINQRKKCEISIEYVSVPFEMFNETLNSYSRVLGMNIIFLGICSSSVGILFDLSLLIIFIHRLRTFEHSNKNSSHRIGLLHTINTYINLIGILSTLLSTCLQTLHGDVYFNAQHRSSISWHCHLLSYLFTLFGAGVYGSCFLHTLFRYWRIMHHPRILLQNPIFHLLLIFIHWILISLLLIPTIPRSSYIPSDHVCLIPFDDRYTAAYISSIVTVLPVSGIFLLYMKIILYMKHHFQTRQERKRTRHDRSMIRRIFILVIMIFQTSSTGVILWILTFFQENLHRLFYRLLRLLVILCMLICSMALLFLSPQLRRIVRSKQRKHRASLNNIDEITPVRNASTSQF